MLLIPICGVQSGRWLSGAKAGWSLRLRSANVANSISQQQCAEGKHGYDNMYIIHCLFSETESPLSLQDRFFSYYVNKIIANIFYRTVLSVVLPDYCFQV